MRRDRERVADMLEAIDRIERQNLGGERAFRENELIQIWTVYHLQLIGEAAARLGAAFHRRHPAIPWKAMIAMRNIMVHAYFRIDLDEVWRTTLRDLPVLREHLGKLLDDMK